MIVDLKDYNREDLEKLFNIAKAKLITALEEKLISLKSFEASDACFLSVKKLAQVKSSGRLEWQQLETISVRLSAYKRQEEMNRINELKSSTETSDKEDGKSNGGQKL